LSTNTFKAAPILVASFLSTRLGVGLGCGVLFRLGDSGFNHLVLFRRFGRLLDGFLGGSSAGLIAVGPQEYQERQADSQPRPG
jgi:hypothetical protein